MSDHDTWPCPWCGGEMTGPHPKCQAAVKEDHDAVTALEAERDRLREALAALYHSVRAPHVSYESGCCMCGDDMNCHASSMYAGHSPCDSGLYHMSAAMEQARAALTPEADT